MHQLFLAQDGGDYDSGALWLGDLGYRTYSSQILGEELTFVNMFNLFPLQGIFSNLF